MVTITGSSDDAQNLAEVGGFGFNSKAAQIAIAYGRPKVKAMWNFNREFAIENARNKLLSLDLFRLAKLPTPKYSIDPTDLSFPVLGRKIHHSQGSDIVFINNRKVVPVCDYYIEFLPVEDEYRYHVMRDECFLASIKHGGDAKCYCRNLSTGWKFKDIDKDSTLEVLAVSAVQALGLDFGAVDIIISGGKAYLLEVNTAPGLIKRRLKKYTTAIKEQTEQLLEDINKRAVRNERENVGL